MLTENYTYYTREGQLRMNREKNTVIPTEEEHRLYKKMEAFHQGNNTLNHVEDVRSPFKILNAGLKRFRIIRIKK